MLWRDELTSSLGVFTFIATCISLFSIWLQLKNYRKPILQRYVVRILLMYVYLTGMFINGSGYPYMAFRRGGVSKTSLSLP